VIRHAGAMAKEIREPGRLNDPDEGRLKITARHRDGYIGPGDTTAGPSCFRQVISFSTRRISSASVKAGANFSPGFTLASIFSVVRRGSIRVKAKLFDHALEVAAARSVESGRGNAAAISRSQARSCCTFGIVTYISGHTK